MTDIETLLAKPGLLRMPCCFDALSARLIEQAGFPLSFMSGFSVSAARLAVPDTGLISFGEMLDQGRNICSATRLPIIADGDTGYGNELNVKRTVHGFAQAGFAGVMIEDQRAPKRCGHTRGKEVVERDEAVRRMRAALEARDEVRAGGKAFVVIARTDARATRGLDEAIDRAKKFAEMGADILFVEAPCSEQEMEKICAEVPGHKMANLVEQGDTPVLSPSQLEQMGFKIAAYPLTLISAAVQAMQSALMALKTDQHPQSLLDFKSLQKLVGFELYDQELARLSQRD
ncbi:isocitrate lyase/PEP mutase family protein [Permianibacter aggregans]|uniref:2-methylisocitrate lyase-like PEP mutase family enzyme n=1 Tax=Permianibacter aggregans TaxID=1510150 RepID=A0A4R6UJ40_9GAMM|nr:isocitrate lyase/PEP mutase family protein [Permianibacter aggregans]QGX39665.1 isocitrate lyase/PEP mutase family protein [Permianibacter aggregans]TDQ45429.1 2-methylisocitrate lyase-like PEP mutase family enzyme [Permianibacter aggregans]